MGAVAFNAKNGISVGQNVSVIDALGNITGLLFTGPGTGLTGIAAALTAGNVITNANLSGDVSSVGNVTTVSKINGVALSGLATGLLKNTNGTGAPAIATAADVASALGTTAVQRATLADSVTTNANLTGMVTSVGNSTTVVTNANLTGEVTSVGNATTLSNGAVIGKVLTGFVAGAGVVSATDTILSAIQKIVGNIGSLTGAVVYQGTWNASTNTPALTSGVGTKGFLYKVSVAGATNIDGVTNWAVGDSIVFDGTTWDKIDGGVNEVITVAGRVGNVVLTSADVGLANVTNVAQLPNSQTLAITGDVTATATALNTGTIAATLATIAQTNTGNFVKVTLDTKGRVTGNTAVTAADITSALGSTPVANATLAATVTTNANLTGDVTSVGNATTVGKINGVALSGLATGILKNTNGTGVPSIAVAADFPTLNQNTSGNAATATTAGTVTTPAQPNITSVGTLTALTVAGAVSLGATNADLLNATATTSSVTANQLIASFPIASYRSGDIFIQATDATGNKYQRTQMTLVHDGAAVYFNEFAGVAAANGACASFSAQISGGNIQILATPSSANATVFKVTGLLSKV